MIDPTYENLGVITRVDAHVESAFVVCERGGVEVGRCSLTLEQGRFVFEPLPRTPSRTIAPRRLGWLLRLNAWCEQIPAAQLRAFDRIATRAGKCVITGVAVYLILEIVNAWAAGHFNFGGK